MSARQEEKRDSSSADAFAFQRLTEGAFHRSVAAAAGVSVVLFGAPRCRACLAWKRLLPQALGDTADAYYEVDVSEATGVARYYDIFHLPTIYLYRDGRFHAELQCEARSGAMWHAVQRLLAAPAQDEP